MQLRIIIAVALAMVLAACGGESASTTTTSTTSTTTPTTAPSSTTTTLPETTTSNPETTTTEQTTTTTTLPGEPIDFGPAEGDLLAVVGVAHDDVLNVRAAPGTDQEILATLEPTADGITATGQARSLPHSIWYEVELAEVTGWASAAFLGYLGVTDDATSRVSDELETTRADTLAELGELVAETYTFDEPESRVTMTVAPEVGDLGEVTFDVLDFPDDAVLGVRLHIFATPVDEGFELRSVEETTICRRGVTADDLCI